MTVATEVLPAESALERRPPLVETLRRVMRHRSAQVGFLLFAILLLAAIFAPLIAPYNPIEPLDNVRRRDTPCIHLLGCPADKAQHIFGIDGNNRDLFSRVVFGSRLSHWELNTGRLDRACMVTGVMNCAAASVITTWTVAPSLIRARHNSAAL